MREYLYNTDKIKYARGDKPDVECILCAIRDRSPEVSSLEVFRDDDFIVSVNLYPFNPGHLMVFPQRHIEAYDEFCDREALSLHHLVSASVKLIREEFEPSGFNIGYNIGQGSGASIPHIHQHIVPRYGNELGYLDVISGTRVIVMDPVEVRERLRKRFACYFN